MQPNIRESYVGKDGRLTIEGYKLLNDMAIRVAGLEAKFAAIAVIASPAGGATTDAQARAAINAIIGAA